MSASFSQNCNLQDHQSHENIGFCLNKNCQDHPQYCEVCYESLHSSHKNQCLSFEKLKTQIIRKEENLKQLKQEICNQYMIIEAILQENMIDPAIKQLTNLSTISNSLQQGQYELIIQNIQLLPEIFDYSLYDLQKQLDYISDAASNLKRQFTKIKDSFQWLQNSEIEIVQSNKSSCILMPKLFENKRNQNWENNDPQNKDNNIIQQESQEEQDIENIQIAQIFLIEAKQLLKNQQFVEALELYNQVISLDNNNDEAYFEKGKILYEQQENVKALECMKKCLEYNNKYEQAYLISGQILKKMMRLNESVQILKQGEQYSNKYAIKIYSLLATNLIDLRKYEEALQYSNKILELDSQCSTAFNLQAKCFRHLKKPNQALQNYDKAIQLNPKNIDYYINKGQTLNDLKRYDEAIEEFDIAASIDNQNPRIFRNKGKTLNLMNRNQEALNCFEQWMKLEPHNPDSTMETIELLIQMGQHEEAKMLEERLKQ